MTPELQTLIEAVEDLLEAVYPAPMGEFENFFLAEIEEVTALEKAFEAYRAAVPDGDEAPDWSAA